MKSFLKWAGGKRQLLTEIKKRMPETFDTYYEPFVGGGSVFFELIDTKALINDKNRQLINAYKQVRDNPQKLMTELEKHKLNHSEKYYYEMRTLFNKRMFRKKLTYVDAALMIYLNKTGWNGMYRENKTGLFNIPSGKKVNPSVYSRENILECSKKLVNTKILEAGDFESAVQDAIEGDFVFIDSPYYKTFTQYQKNGFGDADHKRVHDMFVNLDAKGVKCMLTNSNEDFIKELYVDYKIDVIKVKRLINSDANNREGEEIIITNY